MRDFQAFKRSAIRYWERRRIVYNLLLVPPSVFTYWVGAFAARVGDDYGRHPYFVALLFVVSAIGANICYTFAYALEFLLGDDAPESTWQRSQRSIAFVAGTLFAILLAIIGGWNIALAEFYFRTTR